MYTFTTAGSPCRGVCCQVHSKPFRFIRRGDAARLSTRSYERLTSERSIISRTLSATWTTGAPYGRTKPPLAASVCCHYFGSFVIDRLAGSRTRYMPCCLLYRAGASRRLWKSTMNGLMIISSPILSPHSLMSTTLSYHSWAPRRNAQVCRVYYHRGRLIGPCSRRSTNWLASSDHFCTMPQESRSMLLAKWLCRITLRD